MVHTSNQWLTVIVKCATWKIKWDPRCCKCSECYRSVTVCPKNWHWLRHVFYCLTFRYWLTVIKTLTSTSFWGIEQFKVNSDHMEWFGAVSTMWCWCATTARNWSVMLQSGSYKMPGWAPGSSSVPDQKDIFIKTRDLINFTCISKKIIKTSPSLP